MKANAAIFQVVDEMSRVLFAFLIVASRRPGRTFSEPKSDTSYSMVWYVVPYHGGGTTIPYRSNYHHLPRKHEFGELHATRIGQYRRLITPHHKLCPGSDSPQCDGGQIYFIGRKKQ